MNSFLLFCSQIATPTSSTARPRPPWFSSVGPSIWNTLGLQNASLSTTTTTANPLAASTTEQMDMMIPAIANHSTVSVSSSTTEHLNATSSTTAAVVTVKSSSSTTTTTTTTTTTSTTTPLPNLLVELTEVTVLVPDFPGRRPQSSSSSTPLPSPPSTSTLPSVGLEEDQDLIGLDEIAVDQDTGEDQNGDLLTTPGSSTTGKQQHLKFPSFIFLSFFFYLLMLEGKLFRD